MGRVIDVNLFPRPIKIGFVGIFFDASAVDVPVIQLGGLHGKSGDGPGKGQVRTHALESAHNHAPGIGIGFPQHNAYLGHSGRRINIHDLAHMPHQPSNFLRLAWYNAGRVHKIDQGDIVCIQDL